MVMNHLTVRYYQFSLWVPPVVYPILIRGMNDNFVSLTPEVITSYIITGIVFIGVFNILI